MHNRMPALRSKQEGNISTQEVEKKSLQKRRRVGGDDAGWGLSRVGLPDHVGSFCVCGSRRWKHLRHRQYPYD
jgi:hypothetical protein